MCGRGGACCYLDVTMRRRGIMSICFIFRALVVVEVAGLLQMDEKLMSGDWCYVIIS